MGRLLLPLVVGKTTDHGLRLLRVPKSNKEGSSLEDKTKPHMTHCFIHCSPPLPHGKGQADTKDSFVFRVPLARQKGNNELRGLKSLKGHCLETGEAQWLRALSKDLESTPSTDGAQICLKLQFQGNEHPFLTSVDMRQTHSAQTQCRKNTHPHKIRHCYAYKAMNFVTTLKKASR